jgi:hypothetical protein
MASASFLAKITVTRNICAFLNVLYGGFLACIPHSFVLFFLLIASQVIYSGTHLVNHYKFSMSLNWLIIKGLLPANSGTWVFFSNQGAARYGFTPLLFNHSLPSSAIFFFTSDPEQPEQWRLPESERAGGHTTHLAVRQFRLGMITVTC